MSYNLHFEIARLRHQHDVATAERTNRNTRRPAMPDRPTAPVIGFPTRTSHASPRDTRVA